MKPLNYAILRHLTTVSEASTNDVMEALKGVYGHFKAFNHHDITTALLTAEVNGLLEQSRYDLDENGKLRVYFRAHDEGAATINKYIKD